MNNRDELQLTSESVNSISNDALADYFSRLYQYLQVSSGTELLRCALRAALPCMFPANTTMCMDDCHLSVMQIVENRLFSEGLHVLGQPPSQQHMAQYLQAYFNEGISDEAVSAVVEQRSDGLAAVRCPCIGLFAQVTCSRA
jgi:cobalamin biosynthesis Mg chelatase CobN